MSVQLLLQSDPYRSIALATTSHVLLFRHSPVLHNVTSPPRTSSPRYIVEFTTIKDADLSNFKPLTKIHGTLGLINIHADVFLCVITGSSPVATIRPDEYVYRIDSVEFCKSHHLILNSKRRSNNKDCLNRAEYDYGFYENLASQNAANISPGLHERNQGADHYDNSIEHPCLALRKVLSSGKFYYSVETDLTNRLQNRYCSRILSPCTTDCS